MEVVNNYVAIVYKRTNVAKEDQLFDFSGVDKNDYDNLTDKR